MSSVPVGIVHINFNEQSTSCEVDVIGSAHQFPLKFAVRKLSETEIRCHADFDPPRVFLWDVYVNAQFSGLSDVKQIGFHIAAAARIDEVADIGVARGDHAIERCVDLFERDQRRVLLYGCLVGFDDSVIRVVGADRVIDVLLGHSVAFQQPLIPRFGDGSQLEIGLRG